MLKVTQLVRVRAGCYALASWPECVLSVFIPQRVWMDSLYKTPRWALQQDWDWWLALRRLKLG